MGEELVQRGVDDDAVTHDEEEQAVVEELTKEDSLLIDTAVNAIGPVLMKLGFGGGLGFCAGYAIKKATKVVALTVGFGFVCLQGLQYCGYIEIKWGKVRKDLVHVVDSDGSGQVGMKDIRHYITKFYRILRFSGPPAAGFGTGLYLGFREG